MNNKRHINWLICLTLFLGCNDSENSIENEGEAGVEASGAENAGAEEAGGAEVGGAEAGGAEAGGAEAGGGESGGAEGGGAEQGGVTGGVTDPCAPPVDHVCDGEDEPPPPLNEHVATYAEEHQMMIIFGGNTAVPENCGFPAYTGEGTTWLYYDFERPEGCGSWVKIDSGNPPGRARHSATYGGEAMWVFGGRVRPGGSGDYTLFNDLWRFDPSTRQWSEVMVQGPKPEPRYNTSLTYDPVREVLWVFGGNKASNALAPSALSDLWRFDIALSTWTQIETPAAVVKRMWHNVLFDAQRDRLVIYGGADETAFANDARYFSDLLFYWPAQGRWNQDRPEMGPDGRFWGQLVYLPAKDRYFLFGGHDDQRLGNRNDSWMYDPEAKLWELIAGEDTYNRPANGFCDFPADFTIVDRSVPERRNAHTLIWSPLCERGLLFGGKTDCGAINDVWRYSMSGWEALELATAGEACHRWRSNPDNCANMCF